MAEIIIVVAPFVGKGKRSFYSEPRSKFLQFVDWFCTQSSFSTWVNGDAKFLFGFREGANVTVELATRDHTQVSSRGQCGLWFL
jgi:hypothetical protein